MKVNSGTILLAFFAMAAGLIGVHLYREANRPQPQAKPAAQAKKPDPKITVPMVSRTLAPGQNVTMDDVALVKMTRQRMTEIGINKAFMTKPEQIIGKTVKRELRRGSTFDTRDFYPKGQGPGIVHRLKPGLRAITVAMLPTNALIGFAGAGQSVDVLFHYGRSSAPLVEEEIAAPRKEQELPEHLLAATSTLIQGAEILAFNNQTNEVGETKDLPLDQRVLVTLAVFPREAEILRLAAGHGELSLTLRSPVDDQNVPVVSPRTLDEIIDVQQDRRVMEVYRGKALTRLQFDGNSNVRRNHHDGRRDGDTNPSIRPSDLVENENRSVLAEKSVEKPVELQSSDRGPAVGLQPAWRGGR